ncbi:MAG: right-handed parallel beta-helix repeat-containing protein, partial [Promethearchaeota archaeon]
MNSTLKLSIIFILLLGVNLTFPHLMINISIRIWEKGIHTSIGSIKTKQLVESEKIHIVGNSGWNDFKNAGNCTGSGTTTDPYVIENLTINAEETGDCIYIGHSNVYFIIRNCLLINAGPDWYNGGIKLDNCENGFLTENNCLFNFGEQSDGIHILSSSKITILNNNLHGNWYGIYLGYSHSINVSDNLLTENFVGMRIYNSDHNTFSNNIVNNSKFSGIFIYESDDNLVLGNSL